MRERVRGYESVIKGECARGVIEYVMRYMKMEMDMKMDMKMVMVMDMIWIWIWIWIWKGICEDIL